MARRAPKGKRHEYGDGTVSVSGKAGNGSGSIYASTRNGRTVYKATYIDPSTGRRRIVNAPTKAEAERRRVERLAELTNATPEGRLGPAPTVAELAAYWLDAVAAVNVRPATLHTYRKDARRIVDTLGTTPVAGLDVETVRRFLATLRAEGLGAATIRNARTRLRQLAQEAVTLGYLSANPVPGVPAPKATAEERHARRVLTADEVRAMLSALDPAKRYTAAVALLFTSGLRVSEVLGLAWEDLDLDAGTATIRRASTYTGGGVGARLDRPKTTGTAGVHHLAPTAIAMLRARKVAQAADRLAAGPAWQTVTYEGRPVELCFTTPAGGLAVRQHVTKALHAACRAAGIDPAGVGTHTGRRTVVTNLYTAGLDLGDVARHVGHATTATTARYVQDLGERPAETARLAARLLDPAAQEHV